MSVFEDLRNGKPYDVRDEQYKKEAHSEFSVVAISAIQLTLLTLMNRKK